MIIEDVKNHLPQFSFEGEPEYPQPIKDYFAFYDMAFAECFDGLVHRFGLVEAAGYQIACHSFAFEGRQRESVLIVHGLYDHSGLYNHLIESCLQQGFNVVIFDLPGHGLTSGAPIAIANFVEYQMVLKQVTAFFSLQFHIAVLIGQSTGGAIVTHYLLDYPEAKIKAVLLAPLLQPCNWRWSALLYKMLRGIIKQVPRNFAENSQNKAFLNFVKHEDPLQHRITDLSWVGALKEWVETFKYFKSSQSPVLIVQGDNDKTVDWRYNLPQIQKKLPQSELVMIQGAGHHLVKESHALRQSVFAAINQYLNSEHVK